MKLFVATFFAAIAVVASSHAEPAPHEPRVFDAGTYGAVPDGQTLCTSALQKAIDACEASGGGTVVLSKGQFLSGTLFLKSGVTLRIDKEATLLGSTNAVDYPRTPPTQVRSFNDGRTQKQLIFGENLHDVAITGSGTINGQGGSFPKAPRGATPDRPFVIRLVGCKNILIQDITLRDSAFWMQHYLECDDLSVRDIKVVNHANWNNDTIDIDGCHRVQIQGLTTDSSDDGITLKSTTLRACEDVTISKCLIHTHAVGIKFGTETIGGFKRIKISDCDIKRSDFRKGDFGGRPNGKGGIALMSLDGAEIEDVEISRIHIEGTISPLFLRLHDRGRPVQPGKTKPIGFIRHVTLSDISAIDAESTGSLVSGIPGHSIENLTLKNVHISVVGGAKQADVKFPEDEFIKGSGAGPGMFGLQPACGIHFHYVSGLTLDHVVIEASKPDERPGLAFSNVSNVKLNDQPLSADSPALPAGVIFLPRYGSGASPAPTTRPRAWHPVEGRLMTAWAGDVSPEKVWPEYPRPQMVRASWTNLNGLWDYAVANKGAAIPEKFDGQILVPFAIESALSGVGKPFTPNQQLIYRRQFTRPEGSAQKRVLLHFGAVDWQCAVLVNGRNVGEHQGGYDPFTFDITDALTALGPQELIVKVLDPSDTGFQLAGKQSLEPSNEAYYTPVSGIWQTVWLESVPVQYITSVLPVTNASKNGFLVTVGTSVPEKATVRLRDGDTVVSEITGETGHPLELSVPHPKLWSPEGPFLYNLEITLASGDTVRGYGALRSIEVKRDEHGFQRLALNGTIGFQYGPLDQGFWPDGIYTAPTDEALRSDIEAMKHMGFNVVRKHIKVEPARWYYWCDKLGLMVWQDIPSAKGMKGDEGRANFDRESKVIIEALRPFPSIIMWVLFNEGWGQGAYGIKESGELGKWLENRDPSRLIDVASGWTDVGSGHVRDLHIYPTPDMPSTDGVRASVVGEFGGIKAFVLDHTWTASTKPQKPFEATELRRRYEQLLPALRLAQSQGLAAAIYTQLTDVENELNGLITYDRKINKVTEDWVSPLNHSLSTAVPAAVSLAGGSVPWSFTVSEPPANWQDEHFDDSKWSSACGPFGANFRGAQTLSPWSTPSMWLRKTFALTKETAGCHLIVRGVRGVHLRIALNSKTVKDGESNGLDIIPLTDHSALRPDNNLITVQATRAPSASRASFDVRLIHISDNSLPSSFR